MIVSFYSLNSLEINLNRFRLKLNPVNMIEKYKMRNRFEIDQDISDNNSELEKAGKVWMRSLQKEYERIIKANTQETSIENTIAINRINKRMQSLQKQMDLMKNFAWMEI